MKKVFLSTIVSIAIPVSFSISCGANATSNNGFIKDGIIYTSLPTQKSNNWGLENFAKPNLTNIDGNNKGEYLERLKTGRPFTQHFHPIDMITWEYKKDVDAAFNTATIPLANRNWAGKIMQTQLQKDLNILANLNKNTSRSPSGTVAKTEGRTRIFQMWSHINSIINWGGSASEGTFVIPKGSDINIAHKNGVPIIATMFSPPNAFGGSENLYKDLVTKKNGKYVIADNMIKMANFYGFDGWFLNLESTLNDNIIKSELSNFIKYLYKESKKAGLSLNLYDYGVGQDFFQDKQFDIASIDFQNRNSYVDKNNLSNKLSFGYNFGTGGFTSEDEGGKFDLLGNTNYTNFNNWVYTYFNRIDNIDSDEGDLKFFSDSEGSRDPRTIGKDDFIEFDKKFEERTTITSRKPFSTNFNLGYGDSYYINGIKINLSGEMKNGFKNSGIQSILPTWNWLIDVLDNNLAKINKTHDWRVAIDGVGGQYYGSQKLHITGTLEPNSIMSIKLFGSDVNLKENDQFSLVVKGSNNHPQILVWLNTQKKPILLNGQKFNLNNDYYKLTFKVPKKINNQVMKSFGISYQKQSQSANINIDSKISSISYLPAEKINEDIQNNKIIEVNNEGHFILNNRRNVRLSWKMDNNSSVDHFVVYGSKNKEAFNRDLIYDVTSLNASYLTNIEKFDIVPITIVAYDNLNRVMSENQIMIRTSF